MSRYRDTITGHFVSKETWTRSHAHGGTRYKREYTRREGPAPGGEELPEPLEEEIFDDYETDEDAEYEGAFDSP